MMFELDQIHIYDAPSGPRPDDAEERVPEQAIVEAGDAAWTSFWNDFSSKSSSAPMLSVTTSASATRRCELRLLGGCAAAWVRRVSGHLPCRHLRQSRHPRVDLGLLQGPRRPAGHLVRVGTIGEARHIRGGSARQALRYQRWRPGDGCKDSQRQLRSCKG